MFVHQQQLRHVLPSNAYHDERHYRTEIERLFMPAWHLVATTADLPHHGDFLTLDLLGQPLLVRNIDGQVHVFLNVCAHRHCLLTHLPRGHDPRFRCQYHGWEYDQDGRTGRIPDARCFRPFDRENAQLRKFRTETCGELVFVSLADDGPSLREHLGPFHDTCRAYFAPPYRQAWTWQTSYEANWKVPIENSLESYHISCLHQKTFGTPPREEDCRHDLQESYTTFRTPEPPGAITQFQRWVVRRLGLTPTSIYLHHHAHPHLTIASLDVFRLAQIILPTSATTCRHLVWLYTIRGSRTGLGSRLLASLMRPVITWITRKVLLEDAPIFADVQRGLNASVHPGCIGTREERVYVFQEYVARACLDESPP